MRLPKALGTMFIAFMLVAPSNVAFAAPDEEFKEPPRRHRTSKTVIRMQEPRGETKTWLEQHITVRKGVGLIYHHKLETDDDRKVVLSVGGPVLKRKRFGLLFEVRF
jgi:hypothetical protein